MNYTAYFVYSKDHQTPPLIRVFIYAIRTLMDTIRMSADRIRLSADRIRMSADTIRKTTNAIRKPTRREWRISGRREARWISSHSQGRRLRILFTKYKPAEPQKKEEKQEKRK